MEDPNAPIDSETKDGIVLSFNSWPTNRIDSVTCSFPIGCNYTPLKQMPDKPPLSYQPVLCRVCKCALNPFAPVDYNLHTFVCPICGTHNPLPTSYAQMTAERPCRELMPFFTTVEYNLQTPNPAKPIFLFVVDLVNKHEEQNNALKDILLKTFAILPRDCYVGLITFGNLIYLHELRVSDFPRSFVFSGNKNYEIGDLSKMLSLPLNTVGAPEQPNPFIMSVEDADVMLNTIADGLKQDQTVVNQTERHPRCTGAALHLAVTLLEALYPTMGGQIFLLTSGPITKGSGTMVSKIKTDLVRQHINLEKNQAPLSTQAVTFFNELGARASTKNIVVNYIAAAFEETGLYEIEPAILKTGGWLLSAESWTDTNIFPTFEKYFGSIFPNSGTDCSIRMIVPNKMFKISGCIGPCTSIQGDSQDMVAEKSIGNGSTNCWKLCGVLPSTTLSFYFDIASSKAEPIPSNSSGFIQLQTRYRHLATGQNRLRITTVKVLFKDLTTDKNSIGLSFNQLAGTVLLARLAMWRVREEEVVDVLHFIDRTLIRFCRKFGSYNAGEANSFFLGPNFAMLPQFMYHLRRSPFMSTFNYSPDYTTSLRYALLTQDTNSALYMIQPSLVMYTTDNPQQPVPVGLDAENLRHDTVLLLDTFFRVVVWNGSAIAQWRNQNYHEQPEYIALKLMMTGSIQEGQEMVGDRFPTPLFVVCDEGSSQARYVLTRCNPSNQINSLAGIGGDSLGTDDPSLNKFMAKLKEVSVQQ